MAISEKGTRSIQVDGLLYRWKIRRKPTYHQGIGDGRMTVAVASADGRGSKLVFEVSHLRPDNWVAPHHAFVSPSMVADAVRTARVEGWNPLLPGSTFHIRQRSK